jgi:hypothetical protein
MLHCCLPFLIVTTIGKNQVGVSPYRDISTFNIEATLTMTQKGAEMGSDNLLKESSLLQGFRPTLRQNGKLGSLDCAGRFVSIHFQQKISDCPPSLSPPRVM